MAFDVDTQAFIDQMAREEDARREKLLGWMRQNLSEYQLGELVKLMRDGESRIWGSVSTAARHYARDAGDIVITRDEPSYYRSKASQLDLRRKGAKEKYAALCRVANAMREVQEALELLEATE